MCITWARMVKLFNSQFLVFHQSCSLIITTPNTTHLCDWAVCRSLKLVNVMVELIWPKCKLRLINFDCKLHLTKNFLMEKYIQEDIFCSFAESIFDLDNSNNIRVNFTLSFQFLIYSQYFLLLWETFTS